MPLAASSVILVGAPLPKGKTHVSHVYAKLGVHSQQELIDVVESGA